MHIFRAYTNHSARCFKASSVFDKAKGFSIIELIFVVAIVGILAAIAAPSFLDMRMRSAFDSATQDLRSSLRFARGEAISTSQTISVCAPPDVLTAVSCAGAAANNWQNGWLVFNTDENSVLARFPINNDDLTITAEVAEVEFAANGFPVLGAQDFTIESDTIDVEQGVALYTSGLTELISQ